MNHFMTRSNLQLNQKGIAFGPQRLSKRPVPFLLQTSGGIVTGDDNTSHLTI